VVFNNCEIEYIENIDINSITVIDCISLRSLRNVVCEVIHIDSYVDIIFDNVTVDVLYFREICDFDAEVEYEAS
jgi:hypothetical protein